MGARWKLDTSLSGRDVLHHRMPAGGRAVAPGPCALVAVLCGSATIGGRALTPGELAPAPGAEIEAGPDGCLLAALRWDGEPPATEATVESTASRPFTKYESFQAQLHVRAGGQDVIAPWELYRVQMVAEVKDEVQLHVHKVVTNLLFVPGPEGELRGYLIAEEDGHVTATPIVGGDRAIVRPGRIHHVVPISSEDPIDMIVLNNCASAYEDVSHADFHLVTKVPWVEVEQLPRPDPAPGLTIIE